MKKMARPTEAELEILNVLWTQGPCSVKFVNTELQKKKEVGYTTTLKIMQIMTEKGLAVRDTSQKRHMYSAAIARETTQSTLLTRLSDLAFGGNNVQLAMRALGENHISPEELKDLRAFLDQMEKDQHS